MQKVQQVEDLRRKVTLWRKEGQKIAFVPTMGYLHEGHLSLVKLAKNNADKVIVSIFVNPLQFNDKSDFTRYPREEAKDAALLIEQGVDVLYLPQVEVMYPQPFFTVVSVREITSELEGAVRPGHFDGVATVVTKLLLQILPDIAILGEKDYQQLSMIKVMVHDLNIPVEIIGGETVRDSEGLALSSRNVFLSEKGIHIARQMNKVLSSLAAELKDGKITPDQLSAKAKKRLLDSGFEKVDYCELRTAETFQSVTEENKARSLRLLAAAHLEKVRLIDNIAV